MSQLDQMFDFIIMLTSKQIRDSFSQEVAENAINRFTSRFKELYEQLKTKSNETEVFHGMNPIFVIALEDALPLDEKDKSELTKYILLIYKAMLEDMVLEPQRRNMSLSKDPWSTFVQDTRKGNAKIYDNEYFKVKEVIATSEQYGFDINRCFYQEIFKEFGREDLGHILCEYDNILAENVSQWISFNRDETIAAGSDKCLFRFQKNIQEFSENPIISNLYSLLQIVDDSEDMLTRQELIDRGLDGSTDLDDLIKLYNLIKNHSGIKTSIINDKFVIGTDESYEKHEQWLQLFNRKLSKEGRSLIIRSLPLNLKEEKINRLIRDILENPYELPSIKWVCLNYLQHHFSSRIGFEVDGVDEVQINVGLLEELRRIFPNISFEVKTAENSKILVQAFGKGIPEYKLNEPITQLRKKVVDSFPDAGISRIKPIISADQIANKFIEIFDDPSQPFQLRELALRILISRVGGKLIPFLIKVAENKEDDQFLRGRAIDSLSWVTDSLPQIYSSFDEFVTLPNPIKRSVIDFVSRNGIEEDLLLSIAKSDNISSIIRIITIKNLKTYQDPSTTEFLLNLAMDRQNTERIRQAALEALGEHNVKKEGKNGLFKIFTDPRETSFIRMEVFDTLKELGYTLAENDDSEEQTDWIARIGVMKLMEG